MRIGDNFKPQMPMGGDSVGKSNPEKVKEFEDAIKFILGACSRYYDRFNNLAELARRANSLDADTRQQVLKLIDEANIRTIDDAVKNIKFSDYPEPYDKEGIFAEMKKFIDRRFEGTAKHYQEILADRFEHFISEQFTNKQAAENFIFHFQDYEKLVQSEFKDKKIDMVKHLQECFGSYANTIVNQEGSKESRIRAIKFMLEKIISYNLPSKEVDSIAKMAQEAIDKINKK